MSEQGEAFSSIDLVAQCLADEVRSEAFDRALQEVIKPGMRVLDVGAGSGLLGMLAARAGASSVVSVELDPLVAEAARRNIESNNLQGVVSVVGGDATNWALPKNERPFDLVVMELLTTGMIDEAQVEASNNLHRQGLADHRTIFVPHRLDTYVGLGEMNFSICSFDMRMVRHLWEPFPHCRYFSDLTTRQIMKSESFSGFIQPTVDEVINLHIERAGKVNSVILTSETFLSPSVSVWDSLAMNAPVVVPIDPFKVKPGDLVRLRIRYTYGGGFGDLKIAVAAVQEGLQYAI